MGDRDGGDDSDGRMVVLHGMMQINGSWWMMILDMAMICEYCEAVVSNC